MANIVKEIIERRNHHQLGSWEEAGFVRLELPAGMERDRNRVRLQVRQEGEWLEIVFRHEYFNPGPRWASRATLNILFDQQVAILTCLQVVPRFRAQGLGRQIVGKLEQIAGQLKMTRMWIDTPSREGLEFFKHLGYQDLGSRPIMISHGQVYLIRLEKLLNGVH